LSRPSSKNTLLLTTKDVTEKCEPDSNNKDRASSDPVSTALVGLAITKLNLNDKQMNEADWDATLTAIIAHQRCITL